MKKDVNILDYWLYDSQTNEPIQASELGITIEAYNAAIVDSLATGTAEGDICVNGRKVYADKW